MTPEQVKWLLEQKVAVILGIMEIVDPKCPAPDGPCNHVRTGCAEEDLRIAEEKLRRITGLVYLTETSMDVPDTKEERERILKQIRRGEDEDHAEPSSTT